MKLINHPDSFSTGVRVMMRVLRTKDRLPSYQPDFKRRTKILISHDEEEYQDNLSEFVASSVAGERIYASVSARDIGKASRCFREKQLASEYEFSKDDPHQFYRLISERWKSSLMDKKATIKSGSLWLFDCDTPEEEKTLIEYLKTVGIDQPYKYSTKSGTHVITSPFNSGKMPSSIKSIIDRNAVMLLGY